MSNKKLNDEQLENMLRNYCTRSRENAFDVRQKCRSHLYNKKYFKIGVVSLSLALVLSFGIFASQFSNIINYNSVNIANNGTTQNVSSENSKEPKGFIVKAFAAEVNDKEPVIVRNEKTYDSYTFDITKRLETVQFKEDGSILTGDDFDYDGELTECQIITFSIQPFYFSVEGDDITSYDISCEKGELHTYIDSLKTQMIDGDNSISQDDYFKKGKSLSVVYDSENPDYMQAFWNPGNYLDKKILEDTGIDTSTELSDEECKRVSEYKEKHLQNSDDYTEYFGDTISITVHYKDGTTEQAQIEISIDYKSYDDIEKGCGAGAYVTCYK